MDKTEVIDFSITTPGKVILHGEHSVVYGKTAVAASLNLKTVLKFTTNIERKDPTIVLDLPCLGFTQDFLQKELWEPFKTEKIPLLHEKPQRAFCLNSPEIIDFEKLHTKAKDFLDKKVLALEPGQENAVLSFLCLFWGMFSSVNVTLPHCHIRITSELDIGAGMGSSTAYNICLSAAFLQFIRRTKLQHLGALCEISKANYKSFKYWSTDLTTFEKGELDLISRWGHVGDKIMHGNPSGIDNAVCTYGSIIEFRKGVHGPDINVIPDPKFLKILLVNSKIPRNTKQLVSNVAARKDRFACVIEPILQSMDSVALSAAEVLKHMSQLSCNYDPYNSSALEETLSEEIGKLEELIDINQKLLESLGVSHDALEHICRIAKIEGLHGKLTGAGGGGYAFVLIPLQGYEKQLCAVRISFEQHHFPVQEVTLGGPGVTLSETVWTRPVVGTRESNDPSLNLPDIPITFHPSVSGVSIEPITASVPFEQEPTEEEEMDEWPWPFDLRELVRSMFQQHVHDDLQYDEISIPLRKLCAVNVPDSLPQWMYKLNNLQEQISPVWKSILHEGKEQKWMSDRQKKDLPTINETINIGQMTYDNLVEESLKSVGRKKPTFRENTLSISSSSRKGSQATEKKSTLGQRRRTSQIRKSDPNIEYRNLANEDCHIPKQASYREKLFGQLDRPAKWLKDQFPPYGGRKWTAGTKLEENAKQQIENVQARHKKFLKNLKAGCEYMKTENF